MSTTGCDKRLKIVTRQVGEAGDQLGKIPGIGPPGIDESHQPIGVFARVASEKLCPLRNPVMGRPTRG